MKKTIIKTCICFLDAAIWYLSSILPTWCYELECLKYHEQSDIFVIAETTCSLECLDGQICYTTTVFSCCKKCVNFQAFLKNSTLNFLNEIGCFFVKDDMTVFNDDYEQKIYIQRDYVENNHKHYEIDLPHILPKTKSCFTSSAVFTYRDFCGNCRNAFTSFLTDDLIVLYSYDHQ